MGDTVYSSKGWNLLMMAAFHRVLALFAIFIWAVSCIAGAAEKPIWSRQASALDLSCRVHPLPIFSADKRHSIEVLCHLAKDSDPTYILLVKTGARYVYRDSLEDGAHEILWAPDSRAFFVNGGTSSYAGFFIIVYQISPNGELRRYNVTRSVQLDMVARFPPCKAWNRDDLDCARIAHDPQFNVSGIAWINSSSAVRVFAEVPCSSSFGGIMCQVLGYELSVPSGRILKRLSARDVRLRWRDSLAWKVRVPEPAKYGPAHVTW